MLLANTPRDELRVLRPEVEDDDGLVSRLRRRELGLWGLRLRGFGWHE
jgi:hypothetical protein